MPLHCPGKQCRDGVKEGRSRSGSRNHNALGLALAMLMAEISAADGGVERRRQVGTQVGTTVTAYTGQLVSTGCATTAPSGSFGYAANSTASALEHSSSCSGADLNFSLLETVALAPTGSPAPYVRYTLDPASSLKVATSLSAALQGCGATQELLIEPVAVIVTGVVLGSAATAHANLAHADRLYVDEIDLQLACSARAGDNDDSDDSTAAAIAAIVAVVAVILITAFVVRRTLRRRRGGSPPQPPRRDSGPGPGPLRQQRQRRSMFEREFHELLENGMIRVDSTLKDDHMASHAAEIDRRLLVCGDLVGQGHFGNIYMGTYVRSQNDVITVAIKMLKHGHTDEDRNDMTREIAVTSLFDHDNVVRMIGVVTMGEPMMLCLEYYEQGSLLAVLRASKPGSITLPQQLAYCKGVAKGMEYLHSLNYVHRDLACRNVLVAADDSPRIADFGLSKVLDDGEYYRSSNADTPLPIRWMPKEAFMGRKFSEASDVWSFGITCCEVFTGGDNPWGTVPNFTVMELIKAGVRYEQPDLCPNMFYDRVLVGCFQPRPAERPTFTKVTELLEAGFDDLQTRLDSRRVSIDSDHSIDAAFGYTTLCSDPGQLIRPLEPRRKSAESALRDSIYRWSSPDSGNSQIGAGVLNTSIFSSKGISRAISAPALGLELQSPGLMLRPQFRRSSARTPPKLLAKSTSKSRITLLPATPSSRSRLTPMRRRSGDGVSSRYGTPRASIDILLDDTPHGPTIIHEDSSLDTHLDAATTGAPPKFVLVEEEEPEDGGDGMVTSRVQTAPMSLGALSSPGVQIHAAGSSAMGGDPPFSPMSPQTTTTV